MPPQTFNMAAYCIRTAAAQNPEKAALIVLSSLDADASGETWTYRQLEDAVLRVAAALKEAQLHRGDKLLIRLPNTSHFALLFFGALAAGVVPIPTSEHLTSAEVAFLVEDSAASAVALSATLPLVRMPEGVRVFDDGDVAAMIKHPKRATYAATKRDDPAYLIYTSGTTAKPKGVLHAHRAAWGRRPMYDGWYGISADDRMLHAGAFNWTYTLGTGLTDPWANGATSIIYTGEKRPEVWPDLIVKSGATLFAAVPGLFRQILKYGTLSPGCLGQLRHGLIAGETPPPDLFANWAEATGTELYEGFGMSEISTYISSSPTVARKSGTLGKPQPGRKIAILPEDGDKQPLPAGAKGLLGVHRSDPGLMLGYWNRADEENQVYRGDWFVGGDLASIDGEGYVTHLGRANDIMKALGYRVAPQEVEAVLAQHPDVADVACCELRVRKDVSVIGAFVVLRERAQQNADAILAYASQNLADYKRPREIRFVDALPRTANGKIKRADLAKLS